LHLVLKRKGRVILWKEGETIVAETKDIKKEEKEEKPRRLIRREREVTVVMPALKAPRFLQGFVDFIREQGVVGLAIGLILGFASKTVVDSLVANIFNPLVGLLTGGISLEHKTACLSHNDYGICNTTMKYGQFLSDFLSFLVVVALVYFVFRMLRLERLDKKKDDAKK
jgi:large conductance mechanosensitive channel